MSAHRTVGTLIVGAGQAGVQIALSLRQNRYEQAILIVGEEVDEPYQRPPLSKTYFRPDTDGSLLPFRSLSMYKKHRIDLLLGQRIVTIDHANKLATTSGGVTITYKSLALAVGGSATKFHVPAIDGAHEATTPAGMHYLRTAEDARNLRVSLLNAPKVIVVGGGFIGLEFAASAREAGCDVTVLVARSRVLSRVAPPVVSDFLHMAHARRGVDIRLNTHITDIVVEDGAVTGVELADGSIQPCDLLLIGIGLTPRLELAQQLALECHDHSIVVDETCNTSEADVVAAGDCTVFASWIDGSLISHESVSNAVDQAKLAAGSIAGTPALQRPEPWFWSDQYNLKLQTVGLTSPSDELEIDQGTDGETLLVVHRREGIVRAVTTINRPRDFMRARKDLPNFTLVSSLSNP